MVRTYSEGSKVAEVVSMDDLRDLLASQPMPTILAKGKSRKHAVTPVRLRDRGRNSYIAFEYLTRSGASQNLALADLRSVVIDFYNLDRLVRLEDSK